MRGRHEQRQSVARVKGVGGKAVPPFYLVKPCTPVPLHAGFSPEASGSFPEASGASGSFPRASGSFPRASGSSPEASADEWRPSYGDRVCLHLDHTEAASPSTSTARHDDYSVSPATSMRRMQAPHASADGGTGRLWAGTRACKMGARRAGAGRGPRLAS